MLKVRYFLLLLVCSLTITGVSAQKGDSLQIFRVMCYNTENFLDYQRDSLLVSSTKDNQGWTAARYYRKRDGIAKVIVSVGQWNPPVLVGLCEVGNRRVLDDLTQHSSLRNLHYKVSHFESPDPRGIDVALLYQPKSFHPYIEKPIRIRFPNEPRRRTRDILYVGGVLSEQDTLHVFVCHFPSRLGGEIESQNGRLLVAGVLRHQVDSLFTLNKTANILIMGDFNDYPDNESLSRILQALPDPIDTKDNALYNLSYYVHKEGKTGSYKHAGQWGMLDQIIVSGHLLKKQSSLSIVEPKVSIFDAPFLIEEDNAGFGKKPFRTFVGLKYHGGFSDHLPVFLDFSVKK